ncbi:hypothetical protein GCM10018780_25260 [Streptomyces lanatus]|nr:hypothetical protein GCM10018780_25260 [Streptomyces lanatus]
MHVECGSLSPFASTILRGKRSWRDQTVAIGCGIEAWWANAAATAAAQMRGDGRERPQVVDCSVNCWAVVGEKLHTVARAVELASADGDDDVAVVVLPARFGPSEPRLPQQSGM